MSYLIASPYHESTSQNDQIRRLMSRVAGKSGATKNWAKREDNMDDLRRVQVASQLDERAKQDGRTCYIQC